MSYQADLIQARDNIAAQIRDLTSSPKPDYSLNGKSIQWGAYLRLLQDQLKATEEAIMRADGVYEVQSIPGLY